MRFEVLMVLKVFVLLICVLTPFGLCGLIPAF
jgi:hypothetical protein